MMLSVFVLFGFFLRIFGQTGIYYQCDFEHSCKDFQFDSFWIVNNRSSHPDHTYGNLSGHYISYINESTKQPLTIVHTRDWVDTPWNSATCLSYWIYLGPGEVYFELELAQGDDLQARLPVGIIGMNVDDPQWYGGSIELPYTSHSIPFMVFTNITNALDMDDLRVLSCSSSTPPPVIVTIFDCDFDRFLCPELISLSNYSYQWSIVQAEEAQNYTSTAPKIDYSVGNEKGHYIWLNNSDILQSGAVGYLKTSVFRFIVSDSAYCLSFYYYNYGSDSQSNQLTVFALDEGNEESVAEIWPIQPINYTYMNNRWSWAYTPLPVGNYSLLFRMSSNEEIDSSFALDSISIDTCGYPQKYFYGTSRLRFACDFDSRFDSTCGIRDDYTDLDPRSVVNYTIQSPNTIADRELGPRQTTGWSGPWFLYWSRSEQTSSTLLNGQFKTPVIETNRDMCIRLAYFVNSTDVHRNENNTQIHLTTRGCKSASIWSIELDHSYGWQLFMINLPPIACTQAIQFQITQRRPTRVAVAFDDITIAQCDTFDVLTTTVPPSTTTFFNKSSSNSIHSILFILFLMKIYFQFNKF